ncbi:MAG TPA: hypothetical protein VJX23_05325 [Candidatus Binataceae bacterium]|nr:hypothetical protein [Candidatus Binataceae bacterium]
MIVAFATMLAMIAGLPRIAFAQVGARNFYDPLITQDANPSNEITNSPGWAKTGATGTQVSYSFSIEKEITENVDFLFGEAINDTARRNSTASAGLDDQQVLIKWAYYMNVEHELRLALALDLFVPKGDFSQGAVPYWRGGPMLLMSKGAGDIPNIGWLRYLRPFALQVDATYRFRWNGPQFQEAVFNSAVSYQLDYLANSGVHFPGESFLRPIDFFNEFNYSAEVAGNKKGQLPDWRATPGIAYQTQYFEIDVGTQIALSTAAKKSFQSEGLFELDIYYDQFFPQLGPMF